MPYAPYWYNRFGHHSIFFDKEGGGGGEGQSTGTENSGNESKYSQSDLDSAVQKAVDSVVGKERGRTERAIKKAQDSAIEEWCKRNGVNAETLDEFLSWKSGKDEQTDTDKELRATKRKMAELESAWTKDKERADNYQGLHRERITVGAIKDAAVAANAIKPDEVVAILRGRVGLDEDENVFVRDDKGEPVHGMTVDKMVASYLAENDHLVASQAPGGGGGSRTQRTNSGSQSQDEPKSIREVLQEIAKTGASPLDL